MYVCVITFNEIITCINKSTDKQQVSYYLLFYVNINNDDGDYDGYMALKLKLKLKFIFSDNDRVII